MLAIVATGLFVLTYYMHWPSTKGVASSQHLGLEAASRRPDG